MVQRTSYKLVKRHINAKQITVLIGARQVGKTTILHQVHKQLVKEGQDVHLINIEDPIISAQINEHPDNIFKFTKTTPKKGIIKHKQKRVYLLLDEIQYLHDPTHFLKFIYDSYGINVKLIVTGSSAFYIDKKFKDSLAGRKRIFKIYTFSFEEFLLAKKRKDLHDEINSIKTKAEFISLKKIDLQQYLLEYMTYGGYPEIVLSNNNNERIELLKELQTSYIKKDILDAGLDKSDKYFALFSILAGQIGNLVNKSEISNTLRLNVRTVENYFYVMQKSFHINFVNPYHTNIRKELTKMPKVYFCDLGLRNSILNRFSSIHDRIDKGSLLENYIYKRFNERSSYPQTQFWRTTSQQEVDFITTDELTKAWEVKWSGQSYKPNKYKVFKSAYPNIDLSCISFDGANDTDWVIKY